MKKYKLSIKSILYSAISTLLVLILFSGFVIAEKNTRRIGFADNEPWFIYKDSLNEGHYVGFRFMGETFKVDFSFIYDITNMLSENINKCLK